MDIEKILKQTYEDQRLTRSEGKALKEVFKDMQGDESTLRQVRNIAFDIAKNDMKSQDATLAIEWLEDVIKAIDNARMPAISSKACFSPGDDCVNKLISLINGVYGSIDICVFTITDNRIVKALCKGHDRRVKIRIITDDDKSYDRGSDVDELANYGINVVTDNSPNHMHHKFAIFDRQTLLNGSFNWTRSASELNEENIIVTDDVSLVAEFQKQFECLWDKFH